MKAATEALSQSAMKIGEIIYKEQQAQTAGAESGEANNSNEHQSSDDNVVDAEYEDLDNNQKKESN
jgi:molecular chaperone DnaK